MTRVGDGGAGVFAGTAFLDDLVFTRNGNDTVWVGPATVTPSTSLTVTAFPGIHMISFLKNECSPVLAADTLYQQKFSLQKSTRYFTINITANDTVSIGLGVSNMGVGVTDFNFVPSGINGSTTCTFNVVFRLSLTPPSNPLAPTPLDVNIKQTGGRPVDIVNGNLNMNLATLGMPTGFGALIAGTQSVYEQGLNVNVATYGMPTVAAYTTNLQAG